MLDRFDGVQTQVMGLSVDSVACLKAWAESLGGITYPLLSDFYPHGRVARMYGVLRAEGYSERAIFVIDKSGIIRYVDVHDIDTQPDNDLLMQVLTELNGGAISTPVQSQSAPQTEEKPAPAEELSAEVIIYCTPWCPECRRARAYLREKGIDYIEVDVSRDREAAKRLRGWTGGYETTPTFNIRGEVIINFDRERLEKILYG